MSLSIYWNPQGTQSVPWYSRNQAFQAGYSASQYNGNNSRHFDRDVGYERQSSAFNGKTWGLYQGGPGYVNAAYVSPLTYILVNQGFVSGRMIIDGTSGKRLWIKNQGSWYGSGGSGGRGGNGQNSWVNGQAGNAGLAAISIAQTTPEVWINNQGSTWAGGGGGGGGGTGWNHRNSQNQNATNTAAGGGGGGGSWAGGGGQGGQSETGGGQAGQTGYYGGGAGGGSSTTGATAGGYGGGAGQYGQTAPTQSGDPRYGGNINPGPLGVGGANGQIWQGYWYSGYIY